MANRGSVDFCVTCGVVERTLSWMVRREIVELRCFRARMVEVAILFVLLDFLLELIHCFCDKTQCIVIQVQGSFKVNSK